MNVPLVLTTKQRNCVYVPTKNFICVEESKQPSRDENTLRVTECFYQRCKHPRRKLKTPLKLLRNEEQRLNDNIFLRDRERVKLYYVFSMS